MAVANIEADRSFAMRVLEHFRLSGYFAYVSGSELDGRPAPNKR